MDIEVTVNGLENVDLSTVLDGMTSRSYDPDMDQVTEHPMTLAEIVAIKLCEKLYADMDHNDRWELTKQANKMRRDVIVAAIEPSIAAALIAPMRLTNSFGEETGKTATLAELIADEAKKIAMGKPESRSSDTLMIRVVREEVTRAFKEELRVIIEEEKAKIRKIVRDKAATLITESIAPLTTPAK